MKKFLIIILTLFVFNVSNAEDVENKITSRSSLSCAIASHGALQSSKKNI